MIITGIILITLIIMVMIWRGWNRAKMYGPVNGQSYATRISPYKYITADGHKMQEGEWMYRINNSDGDIFEEPVGVCFYHRTGYNNGHIQSNPFHPNHVHFFSESKARETINTLKQ